MCKNNAPHENTTRLTVRLYDEIYSCILENSTTVGREGTALYVYWICTVCGSECKRVTYRPSDNLWSLEGVVTVWALIHAHAHAHVHVHVHVLTPRRSANTAHTQWRPTNEATTREYTHKHTHKHTQTHSAAQKSTVRAHAVGPRRTSAKWPILQAQLPELQLRQSELEP